MNDKATELTFEPSSNAVAEAAPSASMKLSASPLALLLSDPDKVAAIDIDTVERLVALDRRYRADAAEREYNAGMARVQAEFTPVPKRGWNPQTKSKYALAEDVLKMIEPVASKHGFSHATSQEPSEIEGHLRICVTIRHAGGHKVSFWMDAPIDNKGMAGKVNKTMLHGMASTFTYCERQLTCKGYGAPLGEDTDGVTAETAADVKLITADQALDLAAVIDEVGADTDKFLGYYQGIHPTLSIKRVEDLPASSHADALARLNRKRDMEA